MEDIPLYIGKRKNILIISGGGLKGLAALGCLKYLNENEIVYKPDVLCGTSVGSIICFLLNIGYSPVNIYDVLESLDFSEFFKYDIDDLFDDVCFGLHTTDNVIMVINTFLKGKKINKNITFQELYELTKTKLIITGTCINDATIHYFSVDNCPKMEILKAIRISISMPIFCKPYKYNDKIWIDGGCINNYPIDLFKDKLNDVIGILLDDTYDFVENFDELDTYILGIFKCILRGVSVSKYESYKKNTIKIICKTNIDTNYDINVNLKKQLFNDGYNTAKLFYEKI